jgi:diguanylate cyclase (GGDEF)-like protein
MISFAFSGIRCRAVMVACAAAVPFFLIALYQAEDQRRRDAEEKRSYALEHARSIAALQKKMLEDVEEALLRVATVFEFSPPTLSGSSCEALLGRVLATGPGLIDAVVADTSGAVRCSARPLAKSINVADREYFRRALKDGIFSVSGLLEGRASGRRIIVAAHPVRDRAGRVIAVLVATADPQRLGVALREMTGAEDLIRFLVDQDGHVIARSPDLPELVGRKSPALSGLRDGGTAGREGIVEYVGLTGVARVAAYARVSAAPDWPLYALAAFSQEELRQAAAARLRRNLLLLGSALATVLVIAYLGAGRLIARPLQRLAATATRYDAGDLGARSGLPHDRTEIGALARTFDTLAAHIQRTVRALKALSAGNRALLREKNEDALMVAMCRVAVERAGYRLALVNYVQHDERKSIRNAARVGHDQGFVDALDLTWADSERGRGSVGTAIRTGRTCVIQNIAIDPRFTPWRDAALARGFGSIASFPLTVDGAVIGTFSIIASEPDAFDAAELELLDEMAADLSFGIETLRSNAKRIAAEEAARHATTHDPLTGLPGRIPFLRALEEAVRTAAEGETPAVIVANLPNLQDLHDGLGHGPVNAAVIESASRLTFAMAPATSLSRPAADDFAMLLRRADRAGLEALAHRLQALFTTPINVNGAPIEVRMSLGATLFPEHGSDPDLLLRRASIAAREAARRELPLFLYQGKSERENPERLALAAELRQAIARRQLVLHFQPKVALASGEVRGAEALVRWAHPEKGMIPPLKFVPVAEQTGLIRPMTSLVIELAAQQLYAWRERPRRIPVAVNLSPRNLYDPGLVEHVERLLREAQLPAALLELEITESALAEDPGRAREVLQRLRGLGCKLYIDDFGTGYSSLSQLVALPVHALKIDRSFVRQMSKSREAHAVVASILLMARELRLQTVAEGVESRQDADILGRLGCDEAQGYFFARPLPAEQLELGS